MLNKVTNLYKSGKSIPQVSELTGLPRTTIYLNLKKQGILRSRADGIRIAAKDGRLGSGLRGKTRQFTDKHKKNMSKGRLRWSEKNSSGTSLKPNGYIEMTTGVNKGRLEHIVIMEGVMGRKLNKNECVHHKDGNRSNNAIDNLRVMTRSDHAKLHGKENNFHKSRDQRGRYI